MQQDSKKILFIQPSLQGVGGIEKVIPVVASELSLKNYYVSAAVFYGGVPSGQVFWSESFTFSELVTKNFYSRLIKIWKRLNFVKTVLSKSESDLIVVSAQGTALIVLLGKVLCLYKKPIVIYVHEGMEVSGKIYSLLIKLIYPLADGFIFVSKGIEDEFFNKLDIKNVKSVLAYNSLPENVIITTPQFDFSKYQRPFFVTASRLEKIKGVDVLVDSFIKYTKQNKGTLFILGTGSLETDLKLIIKDKLLSERIVLLGYSDNVPGFMKECDAYVSCAKNESFGLSLLEALYLGVPIVATDVKYGPREITDITREEVLEYPHLTKFGYLLAPYSELDSWQVAFNEALYRVVDGSFDENILKQRVDYFSSKKQIKNIELLINNII